MADGRDPYAAYLRKAADLFEAGDIVQAGQIWQAILKKVPGHEEARAGLYKVKLYFDARATQDGLADQARALLPTAAPAPASPELAQLLERGCALYDGGQTAEAVAVWEEVLAQDPANALAKGYLTAARRTLGREEASGPQRAVRDTGSLPEVPQAPVLQTQVSQIPQAPPEPSPAPAPVEAPAPPSAETVERLVRDGCTLFDMGQATDALRKWEEALALDPGHALARGYVADARRELGLQGSLPEVPAPAADAPAPLPAAAAAVPDDEAERFAQLIREGTQLYDMGMAQEATHKWEQALILQPGHPEAEGYLAMARRDAEQAAAAPPPTAPRPAAAGTAPVRPAPAQDETLERAERLLQQGRFEAAAFLFQQAVDQNPHNFRALQGLHQAQNLKSAQEAHHAMPAATPLLALDTEPAVPAHAAAPALPPQPLQTPPPQARKGLELPALLGQMVREIPAPLRRPPVLAAIAGGILILNLGVWLVNRHRREAALEASVVSFRQAALETVSRSVQVPALGEASEELRKEAASVLGEDPLRAYYRAQELTRLLPGDPGAAELLARAQGALALPEGSPVPSLKDAEKLLEAGELDGAWRIIHTLLRQQPEDPDLKARLGRLCLAFAQAHAVKERWSEAQDALKMGRALFPQDKTWTARLRFLDNLRALGPVERRAWVQVLG